MTRALPLAVLLLTGCSLVLDPSRFQDGDAAADAGRETDASETDGGDRDAAERQDGSLDSGIDGGEGVDGSLPDAGPPDGGEPDAGGCPSDTACRPGAPLGWDGPVVLLSGADGASLSCPASAPSTAFEARSGLVAPPATCGCACNPPTESRLNCGSVRFSTASNCFVLPTERFRRSDGQCANVSAPPGSKWTVSRPVFSTAARCAVVPSETVPPLNWDASHRACEVVSAGECDGGDGLCAAATPSGARYCVSIAGEAVCPAGYPTQLVTGSGAEDTRGCQACSCGEVTGTCSGDVRLASSCASLGALLYARVETGTCVDAVGGLPASVSASAALTATASCTPNRPASTGAATLDGTRTVCCTE